MSWLLLEANAPIQDNIKNTKFNYIVKTSDFTECISISLFCGNKLISKADLFETNTETNVDYEIDYSSCQEVNYSFLNSYFVYLHNNI